MYICLTVNINDTAYLFLLFCTSLLLGWLILASYCRLHHLQWLRLLANCCLSKLLFNLCFDGYLQSLQLTTKMKNNQQKMINTPNSVQACKGMIMLMILWWTQGWWQSWKSLLAHLRMQKWSLIQVNTNYSPTCSLFAEIIFNLSDEFIGSIIQSPPPFYYQLFKYSQEYEI